MNYYIVAHNSISPEASCLVYVFVSLAGYEILAFEKHCLHYHKISTESQLIMADIMRMRRLLMLITSV